MLLKAIVSLAGGRKLEMKQKLFFFIGERAGPQKIWISVMTAVIPVERSVATGAKNHNVKKKKKAWICERIFKYIPAKIIG